MCGRRVGAHLGAEAVNKMSNIDKTEPQFSAKNSRNAGPAREALDGKDTE